MNRLGFSEQQTLQLQAQRAFGQQAVIGIHARDESNFIMMSNKIIPLPNPQCPENPRILPSPKSYLYFMSCTNSLSITKSAIQSLM
jgi:hypothetical protein